MTDHKHIVIIGGGFGGIHAARSLIASGAHKHASITLISNKSYFEYYPGLYRVVTGASPIEVAIPLEEMLPKEVSISVDTVITLDTDNRKIITEGAGSVSYDICILAIGSETAYYGIPGIQDLAYGFRSVAEAVKLKNHLVSLFDEHMHPSVPEQVSHFHVVIVGGGATGVEVAGDISLFMDELSKRNSVDASFVTIDLIHASNRLVPQLPPKASEKIEERLRKLGINIYLNRTLLKEELETVYMKGMSLESKTVVWTAGTQPHRLLKLLAKATFSPKGKIVVDEYLRAAGLDDVYVVGDAVERPESGLAQGALQHGAFVGTHIGKLLVNQTTKPFVPKKLAFVIPVGGSWAIFTMGSFVWTGRLAYFLRHIIDFMYFKDVVSVSKLFSLFFEGFKYRNDRYEKTEH
jgi:NADH dehydrogenase